MIGYPRDVAYIITIDFIWTDIVRFYECLCRIVVGVNEFEGGVGLHGLLLRQIIYDLEFRIQSVYGVRGVWIRDCHTAVGVASCSGCGEKCQCGYRRFECDVVHYNMVYDINSVNLYVSELRISVAADIQPPGTFMIDQINYLIIEAHGFQIITVKIKYDNVSMGHFACNRLI